MSRPTTIGFVGLGNMGRPMAANIATAGFALIGFDAAGTADRLPAGAQAAAGIADLASRCDTVLLSLPNGAVVMSVIAELVAAADRRATTVIDLSTVGPAVAAQAAGALGDVGVLYCDGPVSGGVAGARARTISLMFAGPDDIIAGHRSLFESFAGHLFHVGGTAGQGQAMKLVNNFLSATALAATSEAMTFGTRHGLELSTMVDVVNVSSGRNTATSDKFPNRVLTGSYDAGFRTALMAKDVQLYLRSVTAAGTPDAIAAAMDGVWQAADAAMPGSDFTEIWKVVSEVRVGEA